MSKLKVFLGAAAGMVAGVVAGVLAAPKSGQETREEIGTTVEGWKDVAMQKVDEAKEYSGHLTEDVTAKVEDAKERGQQAVEGAKEGFMSKR